MERLKAMKEALMAQAESQMGHLECVDAEELGEVIDMIKDLEEAMYYCSITKAMEEKAEEEEMEMKIRMMQGGSQMPVNNTYYYTERYVHPKTREGYQRDMDMGNRRIMSSDYDSDRMGSRERSDMNRDSREGRSPARRKMYMEAREHQDSSKSMKELETYMQELTLDMVELVEHASPEEKMMLQKKVNMLATKLQNV